MKRFLTTSFLFVMMAYPLWALSGDTFVDFEGGGEGTVVTGTLMNSSTKGNLGAGGWQTAAGATDASTLGPTPYLSFTSNASFPLPSGVTVNGTVYATPGTMGLRATMTDNNAVMLTLSSPYPQTVSLGFYFRFNGPAINWSPRDLVLLQDAGGNFQVLQIYDNGSSGGNPYFHAHFQSGAGVGNNVDFTRNKWYWVTIFRAAANGTMKISFYDPANGYSLVGTSVGTVNAGTTGVKQIYFGAFKYSSGGTQSVDYDNFVIDTTGTFPLLPDSTAPPPPTGPDILPSDRRVDWYGNVGIPGGIPNRTSVCATPACNALSGLDKTGATDVSSQIQSALDSCPAGQVVYLSAGTYLVNSALTITKGITFRGAGPANTILKGNISGRNGIITVTSGVLNGQSSNSAIISGATKGSTAVTLAAADPNLHPGYIMLVDQLNDGTFVINDATDPGGYQRTDNDDRGTGMRNNSQAVEVKTVNGANITFWPPLVWNFTNSPEVYYRRSTSVTGNYVTNAGVEDMTLRNVNPDVTSFYNLYFNRSATCWARNVETDDAATAHIQVLNSFRNEIRHCTLNNSVNTRSSYGYGLELDYQTASTLVEDNIFVKTRDFVKCSGGAAGNVVIYNYHINALANPDVPNFSVHTGGAHSAHPMMNLFEGNITYKPDFDFYWGSSSHQTIARNWFRGPMDYAYQSAAALIIDQAATFYNVIGNVLGTSGVNTDSKWSTRYATRISPQSHPYEHSYASIRFGYFSDGDSGGGNDASAQWANTIVAGNYDYVTGAPAWINPATAQTIPDSYYYPSKPAYFGSLNWPPIDPVSPTVGETVIPAGYRYATGFDPVPGSGSTPTPPPTSSVVAVQLLPFKNVFNPTKGEVLTILYQNPTALLVDIKIVSRQGQEIRVLQAQPTSSVWDGRNISGSIVASGTYIAILNAGGTKLTKKVVVVK